MPAPCAECAPGGAHTGEHGRREAACMDDYEAIRALLARYAHALDEQRIDDVVALFAPDAEFLLLGQTFRGRVEIAANFQRFADAGALSGAKHLTMNTVIEVEGDTAKARSDFLAVSSGEEGWVIRAVGEYHDVFVRTDGWFLARREDRIVGPIPAGTSELSKE